MEFIDSSDICMSNDCICGILERIVHMMLLNVLLNARKILVESAHIRDHQYHPRKIEKIPVVNNTIPNLRYFF